MKTRIENHLTRYSQAVCESRKSEKVCAQNS